MLRTYSSGGCAVRGEHQDGGGGDPDLHGGAQARADRDRPEQQVELHRLVRRRRRPRGRPLLQQRRPPSVVHGRRHQGRRHRAVLASSFSSMHLFVFPPACGLPASSIS
jgi:hypothetical protein